MQTIHAHRDLSGRYSIFLVEPGVWELRRTGKRPSLHKTASAAKSAAARLEQLRRLRVSILRSGLIVFLAMVGAGFAVGHRTIPNPAYAPAVAFTDQLEAAFRSTVAGAGEVDQFDRETDGFTGATVEGPPVFRIETGGTAEEPASSEQISILIGEHNETCFSVRWEEPDWPVVGILRPGLPCAPGAHTGVSTSYAQGASSTQPGVLQWGPLLPPSRVQAGWFLPVMLVLLGAGVWSGVGITLALLNFRSGRGPSLIWED